VTPKVGTWRAVGRLGDYKFRELVWPEITFGLALGVGGTIALLHGTSLDDRVDTMGDVLALAGALLAVVFTALALVVSIPSSGYIRKMAETPEGGVMRFLDPFLIAVGTQTTIVVLALAYKLGARHVPDTVEHGAFCLAGFLVIFGLARSLVRHGLNRATEALGEAQQDSTSSVRQLGDRRSL
jgi:drug/metabolite transporter (DMT)-like permease